VHHGFGSSLALDEAKFASSDLNAIVSVKVMNQTTEIIGSADFILPEARVTNNEKFFQIFGNCYISGMEPREQMILTRGDDRREIDSIAMSLDKNEYIVSIRIGKSVVFDDWFEVIGFSRSRRRWEMCSEQEMAI